MFPGCPGGRRAGLLNSSTSNAGSHPGTGMVAPTPDLMEWEVSTIPEAHPNHRNGCLHHRMESNLSGNPYRGPMVKDRGTHAHKLSGVASSNPSSQVFCKGQNDILIHLKMHNITALTYINKLGGTVSPKLNHLTKELWLWCLDRNIILQASHLAGVLNVTADEESRVMKDRSDWMLCPQIFRDINRHTGPLQVDLFTS